MRGVSKDRRLRSLPSFEARREERRAPQDDGGVCGGLAKHKVWMREAMAAKTTANRRLTEELLEMANDIRASGLLSEASHDKIMKRSFRGANETSESGIQKSRVAGFRARVKRRVLE